MKRFLKWLETKFSRHSAIVEAEELHIPVGVRVTPKENIKEDYTVELAFDAAVPGQVESDEPVKDIQMPNIYDCDDPFEQQQLKFWEDGLKLTTLDESSYEFSESPGFDPYDTGSIDTSKTSESRSRK